MDEREAQIRREIEATRAAMSEKIDLIRTRAEDTVEETSSTVAGVVDSVLAQVQRVQNIVAGVTSTAESATGQIQENIHKALSPGSPANELLRDTYRRPWVMLGAAVLLGYVLGMSKRPTASPLPAGAHPAPGQPAVDSRPESVETPQPASTPSAPRSRVTAGRIYQAPPAQVTDPAGPQHPRS